jgi:hypothetical protein
MLGEKVDFGSGNFHYLQNTNGHWDLRVTAMGQREGVLVRIVFYANIPVNSKTSTYIIANALPKLDNTRIHTTPVFGG